MVQKTEADFAADDKVSAEAESKRVFKSWMTLKVDWCAVVPGGESGQSQLETSTW